jgi:Tfp pilus assembly protein PilV
MRMPLTSERSQTGETLIEVLMASALMTVVVLAVIGGISTMLLSSKVHRDQTDGNAVLVAAMEQLKSPVVARACAYSGLPPGVTIQMTEYQVNKTDLSTGNTYVDFDATEPCNLASALTLQRITLQYTSQNATPTLSFIKGDY